MTLRDKVLDGGLYLVLRQGLGTIFSLVGVLMVTRIIGPSQYGLYAAALGIFAYLQSLCQWGISTYLVRSEGTDRPEVQHQAFSLLLVLGTLGAVLAVAALPFIQAWMKLSGFVDIARFLFVSLPLVLVAVVPLARLERALEFKTIAKVELAGQFVFYAVALPFALKGAGAWAPLWGWWAQQLLLVSALYGTTRYCPRWRWHPATIRQIIGYGLGFSASVWIWQLRSLVNPLLVSAFAGVEAVGFVSLAIRLSETLGFITAATWRLSISALARIQDDLRQLNRAVTEGMRLQVMVMGAFFLMFTLTAPWIVPHVFGPRWLPVLALFPFVALGSLSNAMFNLHSSALYVLTRNWEVSKFHLAHIVLFAGSAALWLPRFGMLGYGFAEVSAIASYGVVHAYLQRELGSPDYGLALLWWAAIGLALFTYQIGWWALLGLAIAIGWRDSRQLFGHYLGTLQRRRHAV